MNCRIRDSVRPRSRENDEHGQSITPGTLDNHKLGGSSRAAESPRDVGPGRRQSRQGLGGVFEIRTAFVELSELRKAQVIVNSYTAHFDVRWKAVEALQLGSLQGAKIESSQQDHPRLREQVAGGWFRQALARAGASDCHRSVSNIAKAVRQTRRSYYCLASFSNLAILNV